MVGNIPAHIATAKAAGVVPLLQRAVAMGVNKGKYFGDPAEQLKRMGERGETKEGEERRLPTKMGKKISWKKETYVQLVLYALLALVAVGVTHGYVGTVGVVAIFVFGVISHVFVPQGKVCWRRRKQAVARVARERGAEEKREGKEREEAEAVARWRTVGDAEAAGDYAGVVALMRAGAGDVEVQRAGCSALWILAAGNAGNRVAIAEAGGVQAVVGAMKLHQGIAAVQEMGCGALMNLALNAGNRMAIGEAGGVQVVIDAMKIHEGIAEIQRWGCRALMNLARNGKKNLFI
jgi:hypothetical protein